jgi:membrane-bound serine protease (ClpP class)
MRLGLWLLCLLLFINLIPQDVRAQPENEQWVAVIPVKGEIDEGLAIFVQRALRDAEKRKASAVLLEIETFGGRVDAATRIRDILLETSLPTVAYVKNRAWSAGALITMANRRIIMGPAASIGAAEPIPTTEKTVAALRGEFAATAQSTGRNVKIAEAMVDKSLGYPGIIEPGQILSLTAEQAKLYGYADGIAPSRGDALRLVQLGEARQEEYIPSWGEKLAGWLSQPIVRSLLISIIVLSFMIEIKTAGLGIGGVIGTLAAALFFGGQVISGLIGWEVLLLFGAGIVLIVIELSAPGGGVAGAAGVTAIFASLFLAQGANTTAAVSLLGAIIFAVILFAFIAKHLPTSALWGKIVLKTSETTEKGYISGIDYQKYLGKTGKALTLLRPAGTVEFDGDRLDVVSEGLFVEPGIEVVVVKVEGSRIVVRMKEYKEV